MARKPPPPQCRDHGGWSTRVVLSTQQRGILRIKNTFFMTMIQIREFAPKQMIIGLVITAEQLEGRRWRRLRE